MEVAFSSSFKKSLRKRFKADPEFEIKFWNTLSIFIDNPFNTALKTHKLSGKLKHLWSFRIDYENRVVFYFTSDSPKSAVLVDIGTHEEVY
jgi:mRNA-degrading endonuclease YafQ of YafQ-DinJ toxin-antitoxin module